MEKISTREEFLERYKGSIYELYQSKKDVLPFIEDAKTIINLIFNSPSKDIKADLKCLSLLTEDEFFYNYELKKDFINKLLFSLFRILSDLSRYEREIIWQKYFQYSTHCLLDRYLDANYLNKRHINILFTYFFGVGMSASLFEQYDEKDILDALQKNVSFVNDQVLLFGHTFKKNWKIDEFLFTAATFGCNETLHRYKDKITSDMLPDLLHNSLSPDSGTHLSTAIYLLNEYGVENFKLTPKLAKDTKTLTSLALLLNKLQ